jgi:hypothetical protein
MYKSGKTFGIATYQPVSLLTPFQNFFILRAAYRGKPPAFYVTYQQRIQEGHPHGRGLLPGDRRTRVCGAGRPPGLRQVHAPAHDRRPGGDHGRRTLDRRQADELSEARQDVESGIEDMRNNNEDPQDAVDTIASEINKAISDYNIVNS